MTTYYVSNVSGSDNNAGTSSTAPLGSLQSGANKAVAGDTVIVLNGTYTGSPGGFVLNITHSGTASAPITFSAMPGVIINSSGTWAGIDISGSYIDVKGFEIVGDARSITLAQAQAQNGSRSNPVYNGDGISIEQGSGGTPSHVTVENNIVHDEPAGGIVAFGGDYVSVLNNTVYGNANWSPGAYSGITVGFLTAADSSTGYHNFISGNVSHDNVEYIPFNQTGTITDGEGIILDSLNNSGYTGRTLISNNTTFNNGGSGIEAYNSNHVDLTGNASYNNVVSGVAPNQNILVFASSDVTQSGNSTTPPGAPPPPPPPPVASPDGTAITSPTDAPIIDAAGNKWSLVQSVDRGVQIAINGVIDAPTAFVVKLETLNGAIVQENTAGNWYSESLPNDSWVQLAGDPNVVVTTHKLALLLSEDAYRGNAQFIAKVDGQQIGSGTVTALHSSGASQTFNFSGTWGAGAHDVEVDFTNDLYGGRASRDRNLYVDQVKYDGASFLTQPDILLSNGAVHITVGQ